MNIQDNIDELESKISSITTNLLSFILDTCFELNDLSTEEKKRIKCEIDSNFHHSIGTRFNKLLSESSSSDEDIDEEYLDRRNDICDREYENYDEEYLSHLQQEKNNIDQADQL
jgi:hypothetical protein